MECNKYVFAILSGLFGTFGIQWFYLRKIHKGVLYLVFSWTLIPWFLSIFHAIKVLLLSQEEFEKEYCN